MLWAALLSSYPTLIFSVISGNTNASIADCGAVTRD